MRLKFPRVLTAAALASVAMIAVVPTTARAGATAAWNEVTGAATPVGFRSFDLNVTLSGGDDFFSARLFANGSFFQHAFGGNTSPNPALVVAFPDLAYDTYVTSPGATPSTL